MLSVEQKRIRLTITRDCLEMFEDDPQDFLARFVTMDETCRPDRSNIIIRHNERLGKMQEFSYGNKSLQRSPDIQRDDQAYL